MSLILTVCRGDIYNVFDGILGKNAFFILSEAIDLSLKDYR